MPLQPRLQNELVTAVPLQPEDFEALYAAGSDPLIWEQHPNKERYTLEGFSNFFEGGIQSKSAFLVTDTATGEVIGSSRYTIQEVNGHEELSIGYTFFKRSHWRTGHNWALKKLMLHHAFQYVDEVYFYIGAVNKRSQESVVNLGAQKVREEETAYYGEKPKLDFVYRIHKNDALKT